MRINSWSTENKEFIKWSVGYLAGNTNVSFDEFYENIQSGDSDLDFDISLLNQPQILETLPTIITLNNGQEIKLVFGISSDGKSALQKVNKKLIIALQIALENLPQNTSSNELF